MNFPHNCRQKKWTKMEAFKYARTHTEQKQKEGMGTFSVLISRCRCVCKAVQGSTVIGLFSYWGIQSRTEGYGSEQSDPRIPLLAFPSSLLPLLLFCLSPPSLALTRSLERLVDPGRPGNWRGATAPPSQDTAPSQFSRRPNGGMWKTGLCH